MSDKNRQLNEPIRQNCKEETKNYLWAYNIMLYGFGNMEFVAIRVGVFNDLILKK
jgi:hypothetical protein